MMNIIDMHSHIIHEVDDGAKDIGQAINMLKMAYEDGVRKIIATPHYHIGRMIADKTICIENLDNLKHAIKEIGLDMEIYLGNEIYYHTDAMDKVNQGKIMTLAGSSYVLLEFSPTVELSTIHRAISDAFIEGLTPIIAHFERYKCLTDKLVRCEELVNMGALLQTNASSVICAKGGMVGRKEKKIIKKLMKKELISFVASDAHEDKNRTPKLKECYRYVSRKFGAKYAKKIFYDNQEKLICDEYITS